MLLEATATTEFRKRFQSQNVCSGQSVRLDQFSGWTKRIWFDDFSKPRSCEDSLQLDGSSLLLDNIMLIKKMSCKA